MNVWSRRRLLQLFRFVSYGLGVNLFAQTVLSSRKAVGSNLISQDILEFNTVIVSSQEQVTFGTGNTKRFLENLGNGEILEMIAIPSGIFAMGSPETEAGRDENEGFKSSVSVNAFSIGRYPVTQAQWRTVASLPKVKTPLNPEPFSFEGDRNPVEQVSWHEAIEFCARLSRYTGRTYRLPTEAEWEYACRAGTTTPFHFGEVLTTALANYNGHSIPTFRRSHSSEIEEMLNKGIVFGSPENPNPCPSPCPSPTPSPTPLPDNPNPQASNIDLSPNKGNALFLEVDSPIKYLQQTTPVGSFKYANAFGVSDMHGNVWEWCIDDWNDNDVRVNTNSKIRPSNIENSYRVLRGGAWNTSFERCRSASRDKGGASDQTYFIGFRVACDLT